MAAVGTEQKRAQAAMQFLRTSFNPIVYNTAPPIDSSRSDILKDITIQSQFVIPDALPDSGTEGISNRNGMILWLMKRGLGSIYRMAFIPQGAVSLPIDPTSALPGSVNPPGLYTAAAQLTQTFWALTAGGSATAGNSINGFYNYGQFDFIGAMGSLIYNQELAIPVGINNGQKNLIQVTPNVATDIKFARMYAGIVETYSSTVSIGNTAISGTFSASSISDTRDIAQSVTGAFSITNIVQSSETTKDAMMQVPSDQGVLALVGPDIQDRFTNPNQEQVIIADGTRQTYQFPNLSFSNLQVRCASSSFSPVGAEQCCNFTLWTMFVTPWNITATSRIPSTATGGAIPFPAVAQTVQNVNVGPIAETGYLKLRISANFAMTADPTNTIYTFNESMEMGVVATHIFATANLPGSSATGTNGSVNYTVFLEKKVYWNGSGISQIPQYQNLAMHEEFDPYAQFNGYTVTGKYIGTFFTAYASPNSGNVSKTGNPGANNSTTYNQYPYNTWNNLYLQCTNVSLVVTQPDVDVDGNTGPARIIRWDSMSKGMTINVAGKLWAQVIPSSSLVPYIKAQQMNRTRFVPENAERFVKSVYNSSGTLLRRIWNLKAYKEFLAGAAQDISQETIMDWSRKDETVEEAAYAAGMFATSRRRDRDD